MLTTSIASITPLLSIGAWSSSGASSIGTGSAGEVCRPYFSIRYFAIGPPRTEEMISPSVATAMPVSIAAGKPCSAAMTGAQAMVVPWPPDKAREPMTTPAAGGIPKASAPAVPTIF